MDKTEILQTAKPILFNTDMVKATLEGRMTVTRRVMKPQPMFYTGRRYIFADDVCPKKWEDCDNIIETYKYQPGDILYVRETWRIEELYEDESLITYRAGGETSLNHDREFFSKLCRLARGGNWIPSIHMPKEAARIFLRVTDVRVERLQDINGQGVLKEGINSHVHPQAFYFEGNQREMFKNLWNSTIKKSDLDRYGWDANPWCWVIEFERVEVD